MEERDRMAVEMLRVVFYTTEFWAKQQEHDVWHWDDMNSAAVVAYRLADAMLKARKEKD